MPHDAEFSGYSSASSDAVRHLHSSITRMTNPGSKTANSVISLILQ